MDIVNNITIFIIIISILLLLISMSCIMFCLDRIKLSCKNSKYVSKIDEIKNRYLKYAEYDDPYENPYILSNILTPEQCKMIIDKSKDILENSNVLSGYNSKIRNSKQTWLSKNDPLIKPIYEELSRMFNIPIENAEDLQVVRYRPNQYYNEHHDSCCDDNDACYNFVKRGGQRILTVLIYLNNDFTDGETYFPELNRKIKANIGDAIIFRPLAKDSNDCHPKALHAGLPVSSGEKWIANIWFRETEFT